MGWLPGVVAGFVPGCAHVADLSTCVDARHSLFFG